MIRTPVSNNDVEQNKAPVPTSYLTSLTYHAKQLAKGVALLAAGAGAYGLWRWVAGETNEGTTTFTLSHTSDAASHLPSLNSFRNSRAITCPIPFVQELLVNTYTPNVQTAPAIATLTDGGSVIVWQSALQDSSGTGIYAQRYNASFAPVGAEFRVNTYTTNDQSAPAIAVLTNGGVVVAWQSTLQDGSGIGIYAQRYNPALTPLGTEFRVNTYTTNDQSAPAIAGLTNGGFVITWTSNSQVPTPGKFAQLYDVTGSALGSEFQINNVSSSYSAISALMEGGFVFTWTYSSFSGFLTYTNGLYAQRYNSSGSAVGGPFTVSSISNNGSPPSTSLAHPVMTSLTNGEFVIAWGQSSFNNGNYNNNIYAKRYTVTATAIGNSFSVFGGLAPAIAGLANGGFIITGQNNGIYAQRYAANSSTVGTTFKVNTSPSTAVFNPCIGVLAGGEFVISWSTTAGLASGIYAQPFTNNLILNAVNRAYTFVEDMSLALSNVYLKPLAYVPATLTVTVTLSNPLLGNLSTSATVGYATATYNMGLGQLLITGTTFDAVNQLLSCLNFLPAPNTSANLTINVNAHDAVSIDSALDLTLIGQAVNDAPLLTANNLSLTEGETVAITTSQLAATDIDNSSPTLSFLISNPQRGYFALVSAPGIAITSFTQQQVTSNQVQFVHDGSNSAPSYLVSVSDGSLSSPPRAATIIFQALNDSPVLSANSLTLTEGATVTLTTSNLAATDEELELASGSLVFTVSNVQHGYFSLSSNPNTPITSFSQQQIFEGKVSFTHDDSKFPPSYEMAVRDGSISTVPMPALITFSNVNHSPLLTANNLFISEGETKILTGMELSATDLETSAGHLSFIISKLQNGHFEFVSQLGVAINPFTQQQLLDGEVQFAHTGANFAPSYWVSVNDGHTTTTSEPATIVFNLKPVLTTNTLAIRSAGQTILLSSSNLQAIDNDSPTNGLRFIISNVQHGQFEDQTSPGQAITQFTQQQITEHLIQFVHDGSDEAPSYQISVSDGKTQTTPAAAVIAFTASSSPGITDSEGFKVGVSFVGIAVVATGLGVGYLAYRHQKEMQRRKVESPLLERLLADEGVHLAEMGDAKSWHLTPQDRKPIVLEPGKAFRTFDASPEDKQKVIDAYNRYPSKAGYSVKSVQVVYNPTSNGAFANHLKTLQQRANEPAFTSRWKSENEPAWREALLNQFDTLTASNADSDYPDVKLAFFFHSAPRHSVKSISSGGFAKLALTDPGFFGKGIYTTNAGGYALDVYGGNDPVLLTVWVGTSKVYPVIDGDMNKFIMRDPTTGAKKATGNYNNYDSHFVEVEPASNKANEAIYFPVKKDKKTGIFELVVFETAACLLRNIVELQKDLLPSPFTTMAPLPESEESTPKKSASANTSSPGSKPLPPANQFNPFLLKQN